MSDEKSPLKEILDPNFDPSNDFDKTVNMFFLAIVVFITYIVLNARCVDTWFKVQVPRRGYRIVTKALILFIIVFLVDSLIHHKH